MDKPLPPPPPAGAQAEDPPVQKVPVKLERIISPIDVPDLHKIFSGAPQFFARAEGHNTGAPHPSVAFPWDEELNIRDLTDYWKIHDEAWGCVTAWPHVTVQASRKPEAIEESRERQRANFLPRCRERPNMLSMQGLERGTMGYQAALEMGVADALEIPDEDSDSSPEYISEQRRLFLNGKDGLRPVTDSILIERLQQVSEVYHDDPLKNERQSVELYTQLFSFILFPPSRVMEHDDPYSLKIQIEALVQVLAAPTVWVDFTLVEWRIRLGQILWGVSPDPDPEGEVSVNNETAKDPGTERYWLLLQILLSCELLLRLDAISMHMDHGVEAATPVEIHRFEKLATSSVKWSLILARAWLDNISLESPDPETLKEKKPAGWLATLTGTGNAEAVATDLLQELKFHGRHQTRQLSGLLHFARNIQWPDMDSLASKAASNGINISDSVQNTPVGTPLSISTQLTSSYFARRPGMNRGMSVHSHVSTVIHPAGWLSNSYLSGLILPGEGLSHFLMSTLLENDSEAVSRLGEEANLYGGFIYRSKSFWSSACIIGRVLAARKGASECMGWIQSDVVPRGTKEGWVDVDVEPEVPINPSQKSDKPRLWQKQNIEHDGHVTGGADISSALPGDFILPSDEAIQTAISVTFESLDLFAAADSRHETPTEENSTPLSGVSLTPTIKTYSAMVCFTIVATGEDKKEVNIALNHDIHFVTAHPCVPSLHVGILKTAMSPGTTPSPSVRSGNHETFTGHPLHKAYTYTKIPLSTLLTTPISTPFNTLLSPPPIISPALLPSHSTTHTTSSTIPKVLIIDCTDDTMSFFPVVHRSSEAPSAPALPSPSSSTNQPKDGVISIGIDGQESDAVKEKKAHREYGSDLEMLGRALCAERGWDALVSRRGRGCLACAVREAGALGWRVILRVA
ncbi:hypothetical protein ONS95_002773 [Cadophora gregata]|uniref:uncharacterized protein n=1 Tax=Cadophora gregata TaxID=51156 RepID=UPI0026DAB00D|nr:uncharacterized protein ONS95_002773 [Cadophora gregata]KAK0110119.1 hypothetical protein ONS95_002773 [Cadophora gregata]